MTSEKSNPHHTFLSARARLLLVLLSGLAWGCKFSASASGKVNTAGDVSGDASASSEKTEPPAETAETKTITLKEGRLDYKGVINFEYDKANLKDDPDTQKTLGEFKAFLEQHPEVEIEVEGHTDSRGSADKNQVLSLQRAESVRAYLVSKGIPSDKISANGLGSSRSIDSNDTAEGRQRNRRVEMVFSDNKGNFPGG